MTDWAVRTDRTWEKGKNMAQPSLPFPPPPAKPGPHFSSHNTVLLFGMVPPELLIMHLFDDGLINSFIFYLTVVGLIMPPTPSEDVHILSSRTCGCVTSQDERDSAAVI